MAEAHTYFVVGLLSDYNARVPSTSDKNDNFFFVIKSEYLEFHFQMIIYIADQN